MCGPVRELILWSADPEQVSDFLEDRKTCGIFNLGSGSARTWNELARAIFAALSLPLKIEYFEMPVEIRDKYQYFTEADLTKLRRAGVEHKFFDFAAAVKEYVGFLSSHSHL